VINTVSQRKDKERLMIRTQVIVRLMFHVGLRTREMVNLVINNIDFNKQLVYIQSGGGGEFRRVEMNKDLIASLKAG